MNTIEKELIHVLDRSYSYGDYTQSAAIYDSRPGYASGVIRCLTSYVAVGRDDFHVADLGAGTGTLTFLFEELGLTGYAVEPHEAMLAEAKRKNASRRRVKWSKGTAEDTGLPDSCVDWVTVGNAFHLMDQPAVLREALRILRPKGFFTAAWVLRDIERRPVVQETEGLIAARYPKLKRLMARVYELWPKMEKVLMEDAGFTGCLYVEMSLTVPMTPERYLRMFMGQADIPGQIGAQRWAELLKEIWTGIQDRGEMRPRFLTCAWTVREGA